MRKIPCVGLAGFRKWLMANWARWAGLSLLLLAFALRTWGLGARELTFDEVASFFIANRGPIELLTYVRGAIREHPPLYYLVLSVWMPLVGRSEFAIRFLSVIIGMLTVAGIYRALQYVSHRRLALLSTLLLVFSPFHVRISRDARMYGLLALWTVLSIHAFVTLLEREQARSPSCPPRFLGPLLSSTGCSCTISGQALANWGLFWLVAGLGIFTHYFMVFALLAEDLYLLLKWRRYRRLLPLWAAIHTTLGGLVGLWIAFSPGLWSTLVSLWSRGTASAVRWQALARALNGLYLGATLRPNWYYLGLCLIVTALGLLPSKHGKPSPSRRPGWEGLLRGLLMGVPVTAVLVLPERVTGRYLTSALPASVVAMAAGLHGILSFLKDRLLVRADARLRVLAAGFLPLGLLCGILFIDIQAYPTIYSPPGESFRDKTDYLEGHARPDDGLLLHGPWQHLLLSYYDVDPLRSYTIPLHDLKVDAGQVDATLSQVLETHQRIWVSYNSVEPVDPDWIVSRWLHDNTHQVLDRQGLTLYCRSPAYDLPVGLPAHPPESTESEAAERDSRILLPLSVQEGPGHDPPMQLDISFGERLQLYGVALSNTDVTSGEAVLLTSQWRVLQDIPPGLVMRLELVGPGDQVWEYYQFGVGPARLASRAWDAGETFVERRGLVVPTGAPPGGYQLRMRVIGHEGEEWLPRGGEPHDVGVVRVQHHAPPSREIRVLPGRDLHAVFKGTISLIGYAPWGHNFTQGNPLLFDIYWQALEAPNEDYELSIEVVQEGGSVLAKERVQPIADWIPTSSWKAQDVLKGHYAIALPSDAEPGPYHIRLSVVTPDGSPLTIKGTRTQEILNCWEREETLSGADLVLFSGKIEPRPRRYRPPAMDRQVDVILSTSEGQRNLRLLGYDLVPMSVKPGGSLDLTLYWKTMSRMERVYAVFNHLVAPDGTVMAQQDGWPQNGTYHTSHWLPGEVVEDHYDIEIPLDTPPGEYVLLVGMYDAATKERLLIAVDGMPVPERHARLTTVQVAK